MFIRRATILIAIATLFCGPNVHAQVGSDSTVLKLDPWRNIGNYIVPRSTYIPSSTQYCLGGDCRTSWPAFTTTTPGGSSTAVQFNSNNTFAGTSTFTFNSSTGLLVAPSISSTNALFINASSTNLFASTLTFTTASGTSITSTNAFFDNLSNTNFSTTNLTSTNLYISSLANIVKLGVNSSSPVAQLGVKGVAGTNPFAVTSSSDASLFQVNQNGTAGFNTTSQAYALTIQQTDTSKPLLLLQGDSAGLQDLLVLKGFGGQTVSINSAGSYIGPFMADTGLSVALSILSPPNRRLGFNFGSTAGVYWGNTTLYNAAKDVGISRVSSGIIGVGDGTVNGFTGTLAAGKIGIGTSTPANPLVVIGTTTLSGLLDFTIASGTSLTTTNAFFTNLSATTLNLTNLTATSITSTNANFTTLSFTNATGTSVTSTNLYVSSKASIGTTTNTYALNVGGYGRFDRIYTEYASSYFTADTAGIVHTGGNFSNTGGYIYGVGSGVSIYSQNNLSVRGSLLKDNGATLSITGGTSGYTNIATRLGINSSTPIGNLSVVNSTASATATITVGGTGVGKICQWNGASWTITEYATNSITPTITTSTSCS